MTIVQVQHRILKVNRKQKRPIMEFQHFCKTFKEFTSFLKLSKFMRVFFDFRPSDLGKISNNSSSVDLLKRIVALELEIYKANDKIKFLSDQLKDLKLKCEEKDSKIKYLEETSNKLPVGDLTYKLYLTYITVFFLNKYASLAFCDSYRVFK